jgi:hypothetical protein
MTVIVDAPSVKGRKNYYSKDRWIARNNKADLRKHERSPPPDHRSVRSSMGILWLTSYGRWNTDDIPLRMLSKGGGALCLEYEEMGYIG